MTPPTETTRWPSAAKCSLFLCALVLAACPSKAKDVSPPGPAAFTPKAFSAADYQGVLTAPVGGASGTSGGVSGASGASNTSPRVGGATAATAVGAACSHDWDCWIGQQCMSNACTASSADDKLFAEITLPAAGDYVVAPFVPVDASDAGTADEIQLTFEFMAPARQTRVFQPVQRNLSVDPVALSVLQARTLVEPALRRGEQQASLWLWAHPEAEVVPALPTPGRQATAATTCVAGQFVTKTGCYSEGTALPMPLTFKLGQTSAAPAPMITVVVAKLTGTTAILVDQQDTVADADLTKLANAFDTVAMPRDLLFFNNAKPHTKPLDTDGNGYMTIVLSSKVAAVGIAGLFDFRDVIPAGSPDASGNEMDLLWAVPPGVMFTPKGGTTALTATYELVIGTLAHEYQHVINFARANAQSPPKQEALFLNEALSHLAEDITGFGASNVNAVATFLGDPEYTGLLFGSAGKDQDSVEMRGLGYLYLRYSYERYGGTITGADGKITDGGALPMLEAMYQAKTSGVATLAAVLGSAFNVYPLFFPALAISNNAGFTLVSTDKRFSFAAPAPDPLTAQPVGISLNDPTRKDAYGTANRLNGYQPKTCVDQGAAEANKCTIFASGGVTFVWEGALANQVIRLKGPAGQNLRLSLVQVK